MGKPAWQGPYVLGGLSSYRIDVNGRHRNVHIKIFKKDRSEYMKRITTMLEDNTMVDDVTCTNGKVLVEKIELTDAIMEDIGKWDEELGDVICSEPGVTDWVEMSIKT